MSSESNPFSTGTIPEGPYDASSFLSTIDRLVLDPNRVLDVSDEKWGHPEAIEPWNVDPRLNPGITIVSPDTPQETRAMLANTFQEQVDMIFATQERECEVFTVEAPGCVEEPNTSTSVTVILPPGYDKSKGNRVMFYIPGGSLWSWGLYAAPTEKWAKDYDCAIVAPRYRTAVEAPYPAAVNDIHAGYQWVLDNGKEWGFDANKIVVMGISTGGHLALCMGFRLKRYGITPRAMVLAAPQTGYSLCDKLYYTGGYDSFSENDSMALWLGRNATSLAIGPEALPNRATVQDCIGFPPTFMHIGELDPDNVGTEVLYARLKEARSFAEYHSWGGTMHECSAWNWMIEGMPEVSDLSKMIMAVFEKNLHDAFEYDLHRPWVLEG